MIIETLVAASAMLGPPDLIACPRTHQMPGYPDRAVVIVLDAEVIGPDGGTPAQRRLLTEMEEPGIMEQRCWNPDTDELGSNGGIQLILLATPERITQAEADAIRVARLLDAHADQTGGPPVSLDVLGAAADGYRLEIAEHGWTVVADNSDAVLCSVFQGGIEESRVVECAINYEPIKRNLRVVHDRAGQAS